MAKHNDIIEDMAHSALATEDPVELHIMKYLFKLRHQNKRLKNHIDKTSTWSQFKDVAEWKPYDFYHYFCTKYHEKYRKEYSQTGNIVGTYQRIESFIAGNKIEKKEFRTFIDKLFVSYFNNVNTPIIACICSPTLFKFMMHKKVLATRTKDYFTLEQQLARENEKFERYVSEDGESPDTTKDNEKFEEYLSDESTS